MSFRLSTVHYILQKIVFFLGLVQELGSTKTDFVSKSTVPPYFFSKGKLTLPASLCPSLFQKSISTFWVMIITWPKEEHKASFGRTFVSFASTEMKEATGPKALEQVLLDQRVDFRHAFCAALVTKIHHWAPCLTNLQRDLQITGLWKNGIQSTKNAARYNICFAWFSAYRLPLREGLAFLLIQLPSNRSF